MCESDNNVVKALASNKRRGNSNGRVTLGQGLELLHNHLCVMAMKVRKLEGLGETGNIKDLHQVRLRSITTKANSRAVYTLHIHTDINIVNARAYAFCVDECF